jgi:hypothetical protein
MQDTLFPITAYQTKIFRLPRPPDLEIAGIKRLTAKSCMASADARTDALGRTHSTEGFATKAITKERA